MVVVVEQGILGNNILMQQVISLQEVLGMLQETTVCIMKTEISPAKWWMCLTCMVMALIYP